MARHGKIPNISVMPCTFDMDDVLLYTSKKTAKTASPYPFFSSRWVPAEPHRSEGHKPVMCTE
jgi:hypothetical protein